MKADPTPPAQKLRISNGTRQREKQTPPPPPSRENVVPAAAVEAGAVLPQLKNDLLLRV